MDKIDVSVVSTFVNINNENHLYTIKPNGVIELPNNQIYDPLNSKIVIDNSKVIETKTPHFNLRTFMHSLFNDITVIEYNGIKMFIGIQVTRALGYVNPKDAVKKLLKNTEKIKLNVEESKEIIEKVNTNCGMRSAYRNFQTKMVRNITLITLGGLFRLILKSSLPEAEKMQDWIVNTVLPNLLKIGEHKLDWDEVRKNGIETRKDFSSVCLAFDYYCKKYNYQMLNMAGEHIKSIPAFTGYINLSIGLEPKNDRNNLDVKTLILLDKIEFKVMKTLAVKMVLDYHPETIVKIVYSVIHKTIEKFDKKNQ